MEEVNNNKDIELTDITIELLNRTKKIAYEVENSMTIGDTKIIRGIKIFEKIITEINPQYIDNNMVNYIGNVISEYVNSKTKDYMIYNNYVFFGIERCLTMLYYYNCLKKVHKL